MGQGITELRGTGHVREVVLSDGSSELADIVVVGIGVRPRVDLALDVGLRTSDGILVDAEDRVTFRGDREGREVIVFWQRDDVVTASMNVNVWDVGDDLRALVSSRQPVDPARLADPDVPLTDLVGVG